MSVGKEDVADVQAYADALSEQMGPDADDVDAAHLYLCACILAASDRIANAVYDVSTEVESMNHPSAP